MKKFKNLEDYINTVYREVYEVRKANFLVFYANIETAEYRYNWTYGDNSESFLVTLSKVTWTITPYIAFWNGEILSTNKLEYFLSKEGIYSYVYDLE